MGVGAVLADLEEVTATAVNQCIEWRSTAIRVGYGRSGWRDFATSAPGPLVSTTERIYSIPHSPIKWSANMAVGGRGSAKSSKTESGSKVVSDDTNKDRALGAALAQIERQFGKGSMMRLGEKELVAITAIATGSLGLDIALGVGG